MPRRFFAPPANFQNSKITLDSDEARHLRDVLRMREGTKVNIFDGEGKEFSAEIETIRKHETTLKIIEEIQSPSSESNLDLTLAAAHLKGEKFDLLVQKSCELGVKKIIPLETKRADVKIKDDREAAKKIERWRRISLEAAKQSGRTKLMQIDFPVSFEKFIEAQNEMIVLFSERGGQSFENFADENSAIKRITAIVGAEGGWEDSEIEAARQKNIFIITLGGRILRAETAGIVVSALLQNHFGDLR